jgi:hypothetical protein
VYFSWRDRGGVVHNGRGFTRDTSSQGVYIYAESVPPLDTEIHIDIHFSFMFEDLRKLRMCAKANVIRLESEEISERACGFVVSSNSFAIFKGLKQLPM